VLTEALQTSMFGYLAALDAQLPGVTTGLYVVGSAALGDFSPRVSNLDVVAVSDEPWSAAALNTAARLHRRLDQARPPVVAYVTLADLASDPRLVDRPCFEGTEVVPSARLVNPLTWMILPSAVDLRGPDFPQLWERPAVLRSWATEQLETVWAPRLSRLNRVGASLFRRRVSTVVLEVSQLAVAAASGTVLAKTDAARVLQPNVPGRFRRILADSVGYRAGGKTSMYWGPMERKENAIDLMRQLVSAPVEVTLGRS
jgi:hypothetical protein